PQNRTEAPAHLCCTRHFAPSLAFCEVRNEALISGNYDGRSCEGVLRVQPHHLVSETRSPKGGTASGSAVFGASNGSDVDRCGPKAPQAPLRRTAERRHSSRGLPAGSNGRLGGRPPSCSPLRWSSHGRSPARHSAGRTLGNSSSIPVRPSSHS